MVLDTPTQDCPVQWKLKDALHCVHAVRSFDPSLHLPGTGARNFGTFVRQMHNHHFKSVDSFTWYHESFRPGCPWLDGGMKTRRRVQRRTKSPACSQPQE